MGICSMFRCLTNCFTCTGIRMIPVLGVIRESTGPVAPTPERRSSFPVIGELLMAFTLTTTQQVTLSVAFTDKKGNPAQVDGTPQWFVDNPAVLALTPAADGMSCLVAAINPLGIAKVSVQADADLGAGVVDVVGVLDCEVTAGMASVVVITPGVVEEQP